MTLRELAELRAFAGPQPKVRRFHFQSMGQGHRYSAIALTSEVAEQVIRAEHPEVGELVLATVVAVPCNRTTLRYMATKELHREN